MASSANAAVEITAFASMRDAAAAAMADPDFTLIFMVIFPLEGCVSTLSFVHGRTVHKRGYGGVRNDVSRFGK
jgi:hypothetical protein